VGECGATFSSPDENARAGETAPKFQRQPTLAAPLVVHSTFKSNYQLNHQLFLVFYKKKSTTVLESI